MKRKRLAVYTTILTLIILGISITYWLVFAGSQDVYKKFYGVDNVKFLFTIDSNTPGFNGFNQPMGVVAKGNMIYVSDTENNVVRVFDKNGRYIKDIGSEGKLKLRKPYGLAISPDNRLYVGELENKTISIFDLDGRPIGSQVMRQYTPGPMTFDKNGNLFVIDESNQKVWVYENWQGNVKASFGSYGGDRGQFGFPRGILTIDNKIYVSDSNNFRVQIFDMKGNFVKMFLERKQGQVDKNAVGLPGSLALDSRGRIFLTDVHNHKIKVFDSKGKMLYEFGEKGVYEGQFMYPAGISIDRDRLYVADRANNRIQVFKIIK